MAVGKAGYRKTLFGNQTITTASDGDAQKEGQVGAANIFGGAPKIRFPGGPAAGQPSFAQLQGEGLARPAPQVAPTGDPEGLLGSVSAQLAAGYGGQPDFSATTPSTNAFTPTSSGVNRFGGGPSSILTPLEGETEEEYQERKKAYEAEEQRKKDAENAAASGTFRYKPRSGNSLSGIGYRGTMGSGDGDAAFAAMHSAFTSQDATTGELVFNSQADLNRYTAAETAFEKSAKSPSAVLGGSESQQSTARTIETLNQYRSIPMLNAIFAMSEPEKKDFLDKYSGSGKGGFANDPAIVASRAELVTFLSGLGIPMPGASNTSGTPTPTPTPGGGGGGGGSDSVPLPDYSKLAINDKDLLARVNAFLGRSGGNLSVGAPNIQPYGGIAAPTMAGAEQGPEATRGLQADLIAAVQAALKTPSRYDNEAFTSIRDAAEANLGAQFGQENRAMQEQLANRGLQASSIAARQGESLGERQARVRSDLTAGLLREAATTQAGDRAQAMTSGQNLYAEVANQQINRFNALQGQYQNAVSEGRMGEAMRIENEMANLNRGLSAVQGVLSNNLGVGQLQQGGALESRRLSLAERTFYMDQLKVLYGPDWYSKLTPADKKLLGIA